MSATPTVGESTDRRADIPKTSRLDTAAGLTTAQMMAVVEKIIQADPEGMQRWVDDHRAAEQARADGRTVPPVPPHLNDDAIRIYCDVASAVATIARHGARQVAPARLRGARRRGAGRPRAQASRSSAASGDSGRGGSDPPLAPSERCARSAAWALRANGGVS